MNSGRPKVLHEVGGAPMIEHIFDASAAIADIPPVLVIAPDDADLPALFGHRALYVVQPEPWGTGHATMMAAEVLQGRSRQVIVTYGDMPLLTAATLQELADRQASTGAAVVLLSVEREPDMAFGRVRRAENSRLLEVVEVADAKQRPNSADLLAIREMNAGVYCFDADFLWRNLPHLPIQQARRGQEYYLTDMIGLAVKQGLPVEGILADDPDECLGAGTREELTIVEKAFRRRANRRWLNAGVTLIDPDATYIDQAVTIGQDTVIWPNSYLQGLTEIGAGCVIGPNSIIRDSKVGDNCHLEQVVLEETDVAAGTRLKPFTHIVG